MQKNSSSCEGGEAKDIFKIVGIPASLFIKETHT